VLFFYLIIEYYIYIYNLLLNSLRKSQHEIKASLPCIYIKRKTHVIIAMKYTTKSYSYRVMRSVSDPIILYC